MAGSLGVISHPGEAVLEAVDSLLSAAFSPEPVPATSASLGHLARMLPLTGQTDCPSPARGNLLFCCVPELPATSVGGPTSVPLLLPAESPPWME